MYRYLIWKEILLIIYKIKKLKKSVTKIDINFTLKYTLITLFIKQSCIEMCHIKCIKMYYNLH